ncbi:MAG: DHH family phosphoesterase [bacterium]
MMNSTYNKLYSDVGRLITNNASFFIAGHRRPDGDSIAAQLLIRSLLKSLNKRGDLYSADPVPHNLLFLPGVSHMRVCKKLHTAYDVAFIIECSGQDRMGNIINLAKQVKKVVNIDHHAHFNAFGDINIINPHASSSCEQIHGLFEYLGVKIGYPEAVCLFTGIATDTGYFRHANTSSHALALVSQYVALGVKPDEVYQKIYQQKSMPDLHFLGKTLIRLQLDRDKKNSCFNPAVRDGRYRRYY